MRQSNNYTNLCLPRTSDNTHRLALNGLKFQDNTEANSIGKALVSFNTYGEVEWGNIASNYTFGDRIFWVGNFETETTYRKNTIIAAINEINAQGYSANDPKYIGVLLDYEDQKISESGVIDLPTTTILTGFDTQGQSVRPVRVELDDTLTTNIDRFINIRGACLISSLEFRGNNKCDYILKYDDDEKDGPFNIFSAVFGGSDVSTFHIHKSERMIMRNSTIRGSSAQANTIGILLTEGSAFCYNCEFIIVPVGPGAGTPYIGVYIDNPFSPGPPKIGVFNNCIFSDLTDAIQIINGDVIITGCSFELCERVIDGTNAVDATLSMSGGTTDQITNYVIEANDKLTINISGTVVDTSLIKIDPYDLDNVGIITLNDNVDYERGTQIIGSVNVGTHSFPSRTHMGEGGSDPRDTVIYKTTDDITFTDVSNDFLTSVATGIDLFDDLTAGYLYIGDAAKFSVIQVNILVAEVSTVGDIIFEYWDGSAWIEVNGMSVQAEYPYGSYANSHFSVIEEQDILFDLNILLSTTWDLTTVNSVSKYWIRYAIQNTITTTANVGYMKLIGNSMTVQPDGSIIQYGKSRVEKIIPFDVNSFIGIGSSKPLDSDLYASTALEVGRTGNRFGNNDIAGSCFFVPTDLDSSSPLVFRMAFMTTSTNASQPDFNMIITWADFIEGDRMYTTAPTTTTATNEQSLSFTLTPNQTNGKNLVIQKISLPIPTLVSGSAGGEINNLIFITLERTSDSNTNNLILVQVAPYYISWRQGLSRTI